MSDCSSNSTDGRDSPVFAAPTTSSPMTSRTSSHSTAGVQLQRHSGHRKHSAERTSVHTRTIVHTRMEDEDVHKEYSYGEILGEGSFGKVYRAQQLRTGETVAIKEIVKEKAGSSGLRQLEKEVSIFKKVDHKNIINLKEVIESPKKMYLIMELCKGGDLARLLKKLGHLIEEDTKVIMSSLAEAIKYLHQQGILHRDLKLENILLADEPTGTNSILIKVSDFGLSTQQANNSFESMQEQYCGTPSYMAPEMNSTYSYPVDVWAMGVIMYYLLTQYPKDNELNESISQDGPKFEEPQWKNISDQAKDLLRAMLNKDPAHRLSSGEVLGHEWFTGKKKEHGNVLELMKEYGREQKESGGSTASSTDGESLKSSAINGLSQKSDPSPVVTTKREPRTGSGNKKPSSGDQRKSVTSTVSSANTKLKVTGSPFGSPTIRPANKTPRSVMEPSNKLKTMSTSTASNKTSVSNGPPKKTPSDATSRTALTLKTKKK
ncbi:unnamed protein product [Lymnaea stagnalis]|uniref:non-specific serine/threonine protein kinase n=1 Tax=Lymnaea stagnalis TaxID=6523 RepID=A0AAV2HET4_LYMST